MGFFKKVLGTTAIIGAAIGGVSYIKKRKEEKKSEDNIFEDFDDEKVFDFDTNSDADGNKKVTITFNSRKAKAMADSAADTVIDLTEKAKVQVVDTVGEDKVATVMETVEKASTIAKDKATQAKDIIVEKVGEDNIDATKDLVNNAVDLVKDKVSETVEKVKSTKSNDINFDEFDAETEDDIENFTDIHDEDFDVLDENTTANKSVQDDNTDKNTVSPEDFLSDELDEL